VESSEKGWGGVFPHGVERKICTLYVVGYEKIIELKRENIKE
jgi:hypothetical protein